MGTNFFFLNQHTVLWMTSVLEYRMPHSIISRFISRLAILYEICRVQINELHKNGENPDAVVQKKIISTALRFFAIYFECFYVIFYVFNL